MHRVLILIFCIMAMIAICIKPTFSLCTEKISEDQEEGSEVGYPNLETKNAKLWDPAGENFINLPIEECDAKDVVNQTQFAELRYLDMSPPCETTTLSGYCGIRRFQNITLIAKFVVKNYNEQLRVRVHLIDKNFGFETSVWPEFGACHKIFNITCPQERGIVHSYIHRELPKEIPAASGIIRVRLVSVNDKNEKNVAICRQIKLHVL